MNANNMKWKVYDLMEATGAIFGAVKALWNVSQEVDEGVDYYREKEIESDLPRDIKYAISKAEQLTKLLREWVKEAEANESK